MEKNNLKQRMYSFVIYQLSGIQAGIQAGHATEQFIEEYHGLPELKARVKDKTVILLNGGTTNQIGIDYYQKDTYVGTMDMYLQTLLDLNIPVSPFYEPDLNNAMTAMSFLVDERIWDKEKYPDPNIKDLRKNLNEVDEIFGVTDGDLLENYFTSMFGEKNRNIAKLRVFLKDKKLASN